MSFFPIQDHYGASFSKFFKGGWNGFSFEYAIWKFWFCVMFIASLVSIFYFRFNKMNGLQHFLSDNSFGVHVFHAPILIGLSVLCKNILFLPILKLLVTGGFSVIFSFMVAYGIRKVKILKRVFL